ncbi:deoxyguanosinetriphosphate triphosphohydrolase [Entomobacter blattae]|uniref:Deoxyguanosinetriphosphate triphosphohydrolase-like protein n=1 Tax=Entomobacter blattae TaxID=2762277 RepID=A0A7H1NUB6_9PROT|nr:deoxyguanosinetriphosphate triphosphohydrolase [Entomobacter blattae]QNT79376.1 Deoxyguanosinetriphosphate triphosphohydrolase-like protein [Entomobacter blattae]
MAEAPYASKKASSKGRLYPEEESAARSLWQRDRDRVIHSSGFRTLQYKTQVFINHEGDFFRTRLTHSLEVAQIARSVARYLGLNQDLTETIALAHDLGHPPFGHAGEEALREAMKMWGSFDHNTQSLRLVTKLERRYIFFDGLNLTWESLEGLVKHNGPIKKPNLYIQEIDQRYHLLLQSYASLEAQIASIADDIAYHCHDIDDGLRAGLLSFKDMQTLPLIGDVYGEVIDLLKQQRTPDLSRYDTDQRIRHEMIRRVINILVLDLTEQTKRNIEEWNIRSVEDVRTAQKPVVGFSDPIARASRLIRQFLKARMYRHWRVMRMTAKAKKIIYELFEVLSSDPNLLPDGWNERAKAANALMGRNGVCRVVADYIASMSDRSAMDEHRRLTDMTVIA